MATLDGVNIFGICVRMTRSNMPRESSDAAAPGVNGVESTDLGLRGRVTRVHGRLLADSAPNLSAACQAFESFMDGEVHVLVDTENIVWLNVKVESFAPVPGSKHVDPYYGFSVAYEAALRHLT